MTFIPEAIRETTSTLRAHSMNVDDNTAEDGHLIAEDHSHVPDVAGTLMACASKFSAPEVDAGLYLPVGHLAEGFDTLNQDLTGDQAHTLRDGHHEGVPAVLEPMPFDTTQITHRANRSNPDHGDPSPSIASTGHPPAFFSVMPETGQGADLTAREIGDDEPAPSLGVTGIRDRGTRVVEEEAVPLAMRGRADGAELEAGEPGVYNSLRAGDGGSSRANTVLTPQLAVRRLTPRECERLMGWPDDWTRWAADGSEVADSHRYRMCGNGVVSPVTAWIGARIIICEQGEIPT